MAQEEAMKKRGKGNYLTLTGCKDLSGKHPVSALLELCTRRRWGPPSFSQVSTAYEWANILRCEENIIKVQIFQSKSYDIF